MLFQIGCELAPILAIPQTGRSAPDRQWDGGSSRGAEGPSTTGNDLLAGTALPDADSLALDRVLAAESAGVLGVLRDFDLLDLTTERSTVTGTVLSGDSDLDSSLRLLWLWVR